MVENPRRHQIRKLKGIGGAIASFTLIACGNSGTAPQNTDSQNQDVLGAAVGGNSNLNLKFPFENTWYFTGGPHFDGLSNGVRYAVDFAPPEVVNCPGGATLTNETVIASESGKVLRVGNPFDSTDPNHSIVETIDNNGFIVGYMHLDNIGVKVGQEVKQGDLLGNPSCETPPGGDTDGIHIHEYVKDNTQTAILIAGTVFSGFKVKESPKNYDGLLVNGNDIRTADVGRFGPGARADGLRNDVSNDSSSAQEISNSEAILDQYFNIEGKTLDEQIPAMALKFFIETYTSKKSPVKLDNYENISLQIVDININEWANAIPTLLTGNFSGRYGRGETTDKVLRVHYKWSGDKTDEGEIEIKNFGLSTDIERLFSAADIENGWERREWVFFGYITREKIFDSQNNKWGDWGEWYNREEEFAYGYRVKNDQIQMYCDKCDIGPFSTYTRYDDPVKEIPWLGRGY